MKLFPIVPDLLYQSRRPISKRGPEYKYRVLLKHNVTTVVTLCRDWDSDLAQWDQQGRGTYIYAPISDSNIPVHAYHKLELLADNLAIKCQNGLGVLCHCRGGVNRSGLLNALIVMRLLHVPGREAVSIVRRGRPGALRNMHFVQYLEGHEPVMAGKTTSGH